MITDQASLETFPALACCFLFSTLGSLHGFDQERLLPESRGVGYIGGGRDRSSV